MKRITKNWKYGAAALLIMTGVLIKVLSSNAAQSLSEHEEITGYISNDPITTSVQLTTQDKIRETTTYYNTVGISVTDPSTGESVNIPLNSEDNWNYSTNNLSSTRYESKWTITYDNLVAQIAKQSPSLANKIMTGNIQTVQFDGIINVFKNGGKAGEIDANGNIDGILYGKNNWEQLTKDYPELSFLANDIKNHYGQLLTLLKGKWVNGHFILDDIDASPSPTDTPSPTPTPDDGTNPEYVKTIGTNNASNAYYATYNYDPTGKFVIGANYKENGKEGGIPSDEDVTNGYEAWKWIGGADVCRRGDASHSWEFTGDVSVTVHTGTEREHHL